ncbi:hypothetical protein [Xanthomonas translucens]|uniref:hypothetical protein n=1 Tax=Xanthomonas campestris pv. translucens TaxID=343 RepID=UPI000D2236CB|nr:hypothetical protein [Xanthomonas translucens]AVY67206.1 hypothetical protein NZ30_13025 [Xanthomonas translucens pv. undulosa]
MSTNITPEALVQAIFDAPYSADATIGHMICVEASASRLRPAIQSALEAALPELLAAQPLEYAPGELDRTAPARIWLQIDATADNAGRSMSFPARKNDTTWNDSPAGGLEVQYLRADLAAQPASSAGGQEPVAVVAADFSLHWAGSGPIAPLIERHGIKVGDALYAAPVAGEAAQKWLSPLARVADAYGVTGTWEQIADAVIAARTSAPAAVPEGWKLIPIEPTEEMIEVYENQTGAFDSAQELHAALLAVAPAPEVSNGRS